VAIPAATSPYLSLPTLSTLSVFDQVHTVVVSYSAAQ
jgi:hypothetical protein